MHGLVFNDELQLTTVNDDDAKNEYKKRKENNKNIAIHNKKKLVPVSFFFSLMYHILFKQMMYGCEVFDTFQLQLMVTDKLSIYLF